MKVGRGVVEVIPRLQGRLAVSPADLRARTIRSSLAGVHLRVGENRVGVNSFRRTAADRCARRLEQRMGGGGKWGWLLAVLPLLHLEEAWAVEVGNKDVGGWVDQPHPTNQHLNSSRHGHLLPRYWVSTGVGVPAQGPKGRPLLKEPSHCWITRTKLDSSEGACHPVGGEQHLHTCRQARGGGKMGVGQPPDGRMLPHVDARAHSALSVHKVLEGEGEVAPLVQIRETSLTNPICPKQKSYHILAYRGRKKGDRGWDVVSDIPRRCSRKCCACDVSYSL